MHLTRSGRIRFLALAALTVLSSSANLAYADAREADCKPETDLPDVRLLIVGEIHGTTETPALVAEKACSLAAKGQQVIVGLEIPSSEQAAIDAYLSSPGGASARETLLAGHFWQRDGQDGRSSQAMFALIERIGTLKARSLPIDVVPFDGMPENMSRDQAMADRITETLRNRPQAKMLALIGNYHAGKQPRTPSDSPAASYLSDFTPYSLLVAAKSGAIWACIDGRCGEQPATTGKKPDTRKPGLIPGPTPMPGFDALYLLDRFTPSPPAKSANH